MLFGRVVFNLRLGKMTLAGSFPAMCSASSSGFFIATA
jgi:hypothetical protein